MEGRDGGKEWAEWVGGLVDKGAMIHSSVLLATLEETRQELTQIEQRAAALAVEMPAARGECAALAASIASERVAVLETEHAQPLLRQGAVAHLDVSMGDCDGGVARPGEDREGVHVERGPARATRQQLREWKQAKARMESELEEMEEEGTRLRQREALLRRTLQVLDATPALTIACLHNQPQVVKTLLERGASACARSSDGAEGGSVFDAALAPGRQACVAQLCAHMRPADVARLLSIDPSPASEEPSEGARADTLQAVGGVGEPVESEAGILQGPPLAGPVSSMDACEVSGAASSDDAERSEEVRELLQYNYRKLGRPGLRKRWSGRGLGANIGPCERFSRGRVMCRCRAGSAWARVLSGWGCLPARCASQRRGGASRSRSGAGTADMTTETRGMRGRRQHKTDRPCQERRELGCAAIAEAAQALEAAPQRCCAREADGEGHRHHQAAAVRSWQRLCFTWTSTATAL